MCRCPVLLVSGQLSVFNQSTRDFYKTLGKWSSDKSKIDFIEVTGVANLLEEQVSESLREADGG